MRSHRWLPCGAQVNPAHNRSLLAVFPLAHRARGCLGVAASLDGVRWSRVTPLLACALYGERTLDQPAVPAMVRRGGEVRATPRALDHSGR